MNRPLDFALALVVVAATGWSAGRLFAQTINPVSPAASLARFSGANDGSDSAPAFDVSGGSVQ